MFFSADVGVVLSSACRLPPRVVADPQSAGSLALALQIRILSRFDDRMTGPPRDSLLGKLLFAPARPGELVWIGLRPTPRSAVISVESARLVAKVGIEGDRYASKRDGKRQVTLIAAEDIAAISSFLGRESIAPDVFRRNLMTRGINLAALKDRTFRIGAAVLCGTGDCAPCSQMEDALGVGGYNAVRGHGGLTARILESGTVRVGDAIVVC